ncbi:hypothetical protein FRC10_008594, partial [Ceratobasidium sp. 414]
MSHPLTWPSVPKFYPMGATPATSLTQDLSPEQPADILLLGSRNIILFTLLDDGISANTVWDIFYHFKLGEHVARVLASHARELVRLSATCGTWRESKYGSFLKFVDNNSLFELRRYWTSYAQFPDLSSIRLDKLNKEQAAMSAKLANRLQTSLNHGVSRSATVAWEDASQSVSDQFGQYWKNGTTATTNKDIQKATQLNPTFCYSQAHGETFNGVQENTFPQGFHFAPAFVPIEVDPVGSNVTSAMAKAKQQFKASCLTLHASRKANALTLRFFVGDGIALCKALVKYSKSGNPKTEVFTAPWRAAPIDLTEHAASSPSAPVSFDVIDTSTLAGFLGIINILLATQPLLKKQPPSQAVVYMDLTFGVGAAVENFLQRLCTDVPTAGLIIGLVPRSYISLFTSKSNTHEHTAENDAAYFERIAWIDPAGGDKYAHKEPNPIARLHAFDLTKVMFGFYRHLFLWDCTPLADVAHLGRYELLMSSAPHYDRETVAALWVHARSRLQIANGSWESAITGFMGIVEGDNENRLGLSSFADMELQHHIRGLPIFKSEARSKANVLKHGVFQAWSDVPRVVCVVLIVPRDKLDPLREDQEELGPRLVCTIKDPSKSGGISTYDTIDAAWGECLPLSDSNDRFAIEEDMDGFRGQSSLIVSFWVDPNALVRPNLKLSLAIRFTPLAHSSYSRKLGPELNLFTANVSDRQHLLVLRERPMGLSHTQQTSGFLAQNPTANGNGIKVRLILLEDGLVFPCNSMEAQLELESEAERASLLAGTEVTVTQIGPCTMRALVGGVQHIIRYPYPVQGAGAKTRVDKAKHHVYLTAPVLKPLSSGGYPCNPFPILQHTNYSPWNLHHVFLDRMPKLDLRNVTRNPAKLRWLAKHTTTQMSDRERFVQHCTHPDKRHPSDVLVNIKESLATLVQVYAGLHQASRTIFGLCEPSNGIYMAICIGGLRLDLAAATVVLDAAIVCWSPETAKLLDPQTPIHEIRTRAGDVSAWKRLVAASVER